MSASLIIFCLSSVFLQRKNHFPLFPFEERSKARSPSFSCWADKKPASWSPENEYKGTLRTFDPSRHAPRGVKPPRSHLAWVTHKTTNILLRHLPARLHTVLKVHVTVWAALWASQDTWKWSLPVGWIMEGRAFNNHLGWHAGRSLRRYPFARRFSRLLLLSSSTLTVQTAPPMVTAALNLWNDWWRCDLGSPALHSVSRMHCAPTCLVHTQGIETQSQNRKTMNFALGSVG